MRAARATGAARSTNATPGAKSWVRGPVQKIRDDLGLVHRNKTGVRVFEGPSPAIRVRQRDGRLLAAEILAAATFGNIGAW